VLGVTHSSFRIGVDGGGTKTNLILIDAAGAVVAQRRSTGCNPSLIGQPAARQLLTENLDALVAEACSLHADAAITHTVLCMAGSRTFWNEFTAQLVERGEGQSYDDSIPVLELATGGRPGLILHSGTGSFVAARDAEGTAHYAGGLGWRFGDPASAYELGRRAVARTILELQGWADPSALGEAIRKSTGIHTANALTRHFYADAMPHVHVAEIAPTVTALAATGDAAAVEIIRSSATELAEIARVVVERALPGAHHKKMAVGLSGVILQTPTARAALAASLGDDRDFRPITEPPIEGVRQLLLRLCS